MKPEHCCIAVFTAGKVSRRRKTFEARFWEKVLVGEKDECWPWIGAALNSGYGLIRRGERPHLAHRIAYSLVLKQELPSGVVIRHLCNNPSCCNPAHLVPGTHADNMADKVKAGRQSKGEKVPSHKLTSSDVHRVRELLRSGKSQSDIARMFGVSADTIGKISSGKTWSWL